MLQIIEKDTRGSEAKQRGDREKNAVDTGSRCIRQSALSLDGTDKRKPQWNPALW